jgi:hypothetical protein
VHNAANQCPNGQYCQTYMNDLGLCCPMPSQPQCPDGTVASEKCDASSWNACGDSGYCYKYLDPAGITTDSTFGYVCCPFSSIGGGTSSNTDAYGSPSIDGGMIGSGDTTEYGNVDFGSDQTGPAEPAAPSDQVEIPVTTSD